VNAPVEVRRLDFDTGFFGVLMGTLVRPARTDQPSGEPCAAASALADEVAAALAHARAQGYAHVIFRSAADDSAAIWAAECAGFRLVDVGVDSSTCLADWPSSAGPLPSASRDAVPPIRQFRAGDIPALQNLAAGAFTLSRFSADPFFRPDQVQAFHREWVKNLCHGLAQAVLVCEVEGRVAGFVSCALSDGEGRIPLIATDGRFRRQGIGRALMRAALRWFAAAGAKVAHVKTQAHNYPALALYHRAGFTVSRTELTFSTTPGGMPAASAPGWLASGAG
jgi:ribosomal protein S18 acetylase RimI-like enzyme